MRPLQGHSARGAASGVITAADGAPRASSHNIYRSVPFRGRPRRPLMTSRGRARNTCLPGTVATPSSSLGSVSGRAAVP